VRTFKCPFFGGLSPYWTTVPFSSLKMLYELLLKDELPSVTAGPEGIAKGCVASKAKYFLPYANGFQGIGRKIEDVGWGGNDPSEESLLKEISSNIGTLKGATTICEWNPGDHVVFENGHLKVIPFSG
jgi:hypothetical protein